jgi:hypothetical protein
MTSKEYREVYLRSEHWRAMRLWALERAENRCQVCAASAALDVHHRTYERVGAERPADLTVLCRRCHELFHQREATVARISAALTRSGVEHRVEGDLLVGGCPLCQEALEVALCPGNRVGFACAGGCGEHEIVAAIFPPKVAA